MRHRQKGKTLKRNKSQRKALLKQLSRDFFQFGQIKSTEAKLKLVKPYIEQIITKAKQAVAVADKEKEKSTQVKNLHIKRQLFQKLSDKKIVDKLIKQIAPKYQSRKGGYTRIVKLVFRKGDNASMARLEMVAEKSA